MNHLAQMADQPDKKMHAHSSAPKPHYPALDGIRFLAAFSVLVGHSYWYIVLLQDGAYQPSPLENVLMGLPSLGMTLFFVLSGYVIHLNYSETVGFNTKGTMDFFIARFARLYPLFFVIFMHDFLIILWANGYFSGQITRTEDYFSALPLYVSFTTTWWLWPLGPTSAYEIYGTPLTGATGVMWSLSTEAFFYASFPLLAIFIRRLTGRNLWIAAVFVSLFGISYYLSAFFLKDRITNWAAIAFPQVPQDQFFHWIAFLSPWGRISEFLLGVMGAQFLLTSRVSTQPLHVNAGVTYTTLASIVALTFVLYGYGNSFRTVATSCYAILIAVFIYLAAKHSTTASRFLSSKPLIAGGAASYSLYLLHFFIAHDFAQRIVVTHPIIPRWTIWIGAMALSIGVASISYHVFERPCMLWVRKNFRRLRLELVVPITIILILLFSLAMSMQIRNLDRVVSPTGNQIIRVASASFGENCRPTLKDNVLKILRLACDGKHACEFIYNVNRLGDPAGGCVKKFDISYYCSSQSTLHHFEIERFERNSELISFSCAGKN